MKGLEPSLPKKLEPKPSASTNSATSAGNLLIYNNRPVLRSFKEKMETF